MLNGVTYKNEHTNILYEKGPLYNKNYLIIKQRTHKDNPDFICEKHWHRAIELILPYTSSIEANINGKEYYIFRNQLLVINSKAIHTCIHRECDDYYEGIVLQLSYDYLMELDSNFNQYEFPVVLEQDEMNKIIFCMNQLVEINDDDHHLLVLGYLYTIIGILIDNRINKNEIKYEHKWEDLLAYIESNYANISNIEELAKVFNYSYGYLERSFKKHFGVNLKKYIMMIKLEKSLGDVAFSNERILDIAYKHGFTSVTTYNREFKKQYQLSPSDYRKKVRN